MRLPKKVEQKLKAGLSAAESLGVGEGKIDLGLLANYQGGQFTGGGFADYEHKLNKSVAAFARAEVGYMKGPISGGFARALAGVRIRF